MGLWGEVARGERVEGAGWGEGVWSIQYFLWRLYVSLSHGCGVWREGERWCCFDFLESELADGNCAWTIQSAFHLWSLWKSVALRLLCGLPTRGRVL